MLDRDGVKLCGNAEGASIFRVRVISVVCHGKGARRSSDVAQSAARSPDRSVV